MAGSRLLRTVERTDVTQQPLTINSGPEKVWASGSVTRQTLKDSTEAMIRRALLSGQMKPGEIYSANALATQLGISNSPAREAMMSLVDKGLLELVRNRGFRVVELTEQDKLEVYELRMLIEVEAVRRAAQRDLAVDQQQNLRELAAKTVEISTHEDVSEYLELDQTFHANLVGLVGNTRWLNVVNTLRDQSRVNGFYLYLTENNGLEQTAHEHVEIAETVITGEVEKAAELMIRHLDYAKP
ncbi:GntR family transcriptional regulator [Nesterenkonia sp. MY13]|uniref:GntR family transcriptional regulator n=1 Tax=Nesterenkonia sedimenti TaxID=1463632 RepID=A0A7X8TJC3_9MICC|nr:GntR family transcriptional regulator [Nesterenkonia sedimenti]